MTFESSKTRFSAFRNETEAQLGEFAARYYADPLGFVMAAYPWGEPLLHDGSVNSLKDKEGPEPWQRRHLISVGEHVKENLLRVSMGLQPRIYRSAIASGHGVGKSAEVAWLHHWLMATRPNHRGVCTANTQRQLETKTWPELAKWHRLFLFRHWFSWAASSYYFNKGPEEERKNYMLTAMTVSDDNTEAFAGLHNEAGSVSFVFDEASGITAKVWEVAYGGTTDGEVFFFVFGNPTEPSGPFYDCFSKYADMYYTDHVDSRAVSHTNKEAIGDMLRLFNGDEEDDRFKVRVRGMFPVQSFNGFIDAGVVTDAEERELWIDPGAALMMAVDVARFGDDETVIGYRHGRDARTRSSLYFQGLSTTQITKIVKTEADKHQPDAIVIESTGVGAGVIDQLRDAGYRVVEVHPGSPSTQPLHYGNKRAEMWALMRDWLVLEGCIRKDPKLFDQLTGIKYLFDNKEQSIRLEPKADFKERFKMSPDRADTLALTFGVHIARRDSNLNRKHRPVNAGIAVTDYDPLTYDAQSMEA